MEKVGVALLTPKMHENRLRWFRHMQRKTYDAPVRRIENIIVEGKRSRGRPRRMWEAQIKSDLHELHLSKDLTRDMGSWRRLIHVLNYWLCPTNLSFYCFLSFTQHSLTTFLFLLFIFTFIFFICSYLFIYLLSFLTLLLMINMCCKLQAFG